MAVALGERPTSCCSGQMWDGRGLCGGLLLRLDGQLRVGSMAESHETEAARQGSVLLNRRRRGRVLAICCPRYAGGIAEHGARAILRGSGALVGQLLGRLVQTGLVGALEEAGGIEGAAATEVLLAAARSEPCGHCARRLAAHLRKSLGMCRAARHMAQLGTGRRRELEGQVV
jgi:hypothetical protein